MNISTMLKENTRQKACKFGNIAPLYISSGQCSCEQCANDRKERARLRREANPQRDREISLLSYRKHRDKRTATMKQRRAKRSDEYKAADRAYYQQHAEEMKAKAKAYREERPGLSAEYSRRYRERNKDNPVYKMSMAARYMLRRCLVAANTKKKATTFRMIGYSPESLVQHLERQFHGGMNWENYGHFWHIDHIASVSELIACGVSDMAIINGLQNLRPELASVNVSRQHKFELGVSLDQRTQHTKRD